MERPASGQWSPVALGPLSPLLAPVEAGKMPARQRRPDDALAVDIGASDSEPRQRHMVDFGERRMGRMDPGSSRTNAGVPLKTPTEPQTEPSTGLGLTE